MSDRQRESDRLWVPDNPDGSGWAAVDWASAAKGSRYHYRHVASAAVEREKLPRFYRVVTRLESAELHPHENSYYVSRERLADFLAEVSIAGVSLLPRSTSTAATTIRLALPVWFDTHPVA